MIYDVTSRKCVHILLCVSCVHHTASFSHHVCLTVCVFLSLCISHWVFRSFENIATWLSDIARHSSAEVVKMLVALLHSIYELALPLSLLITSTSLPSPSGEHSQLCWLAPGWQ